MQPCACLPCGVSSNVVPRAWSHLPTSRAAEATGESGLPLCWSMERCCSYSSHTSADKVISALRTTPVAVPWANDLAKLKLPPVPPALRQYLRTIVQEGVCCAAADLVGEEAAVDIESHPKLASLAHIMSGGCQEVRRPSDPEVSRFLAALFRGIASVAKVELSPSDLYHGHLFLHRGATATACDLGILFHAKEFPKEYPHSPVRGTKTSVKDADYHLRNFLWLLSTNTIALLDPSDAAFPHAVLQGGASRIFSAVNAFSFGTYLGDVNFFEGEVEVEEGVLLTLAQSRPHHADPADRALLAVRRLAALASAGGSDPGEAMVKVREVIGYMSTPELRFALRWAEAHQAEGKSASTNLPLLVREALQARTEQNAIESAKRRRDELDKLRTALPNVTPSDAADALDMTARPCRVTGGTRFSAFRAECLLAVAMPKYRQRLLDSMALRQGCAKGGTASNTCPHVDSAVRQLGEGFAFPARGGCQHEACVKAAAAAASGDKTGSSKENPMLDWLPKDEQEDYMCLCCHKVLCGRYKKRHMVEHAHASTDGHHCVAIGLRRLTVWCYACDTALDRRLPKLANFTAALLPALKAGQMELAAGVSARLNPPWAEIGPYPLPLAAKTLRLAHETGVRPDLALEVLLAVEQNKTETAADAGAAVTDREVARAVDAVQQRYAEWWEHEHRRGAAQLANAIKVR